MARALKPYNIAISMDFAEGNFGGVFTNGLRQNNIFLYRMFKASQRCRNVWLLNMGSVDYSYPEGAMGLAKDAVARFDDIKGDLDFLIAVGNRPGREQLEYLRAHGCKTIIYKGGNSAILSMEGVAEEDIDKYGEFYFDCDLYDTVWMTPQHIHSYSHWAKTIYRTEVHEVPQVWDSTLIDLQDAEVREKFGYRKRRSKKWRVGITDPNITVMKTIHMPALVCEAAYRLKPKLFEKIYVTNSLALMKDAHFTSFIGALSSTKAGVLSVEQRFMLYDFLTKHVDAIVTHHWENGLNYLYYEVLFGGYPLVHNSEFLKNFGYYYNSFDAEDGARALIEAMQGHDANLAAYKRRNAKLFKRLDPLNPANIELHEGLLQRLK